MLAAESPHIVAFWSSRYDISCGWIEFLVHSRSVERLVPRGRPMTGMDSKWASLAGGEYPMGWTDERVELLKKLWADGLSASQIAAELGGITRNAVIGKVHRLGLSGRAKSPSSAAPRPRKARSSGMMRVPRPAMRGN